MIQGVRLSTTYVLFWLDRGLCNALGESGDFIHAVYASHRLWSNLIALFHWFVGLIRVVCHACTAGSAWAASLTLALECCMICNLYYCLPFEF